MNMVNLRKSFQENHVYLTNNINKANSNNIIYNDYVGKDYIFHSRRTTDDPILYQREDEEVEQEDSGASTPPLWKSSSPSESPEHQESHYYVTLSPASRLQAIVGGQRELMEMVSRMPEGSYELSLKDMVEKQQSMRNDGEDHEEEVGESKDNYSEERSVYNEEVVLMHAREKEREKEKRNTLQMSTSGSLDHHHYANNNSGRGFLLKMIFPKIAWATRNKSKKRSIRVSHDKSKSKKKNEMIEFRLSDGGVSPRPLLLDGSPSRSGGGVDQEWWSQRKRLSSSGKSSESGGGGGFSTNSGSSTSSGSSSSTSSSINSNNRHKRASCWSCFFPNKGKDIS